MSEIGWEPRILQYHEPKKRVLIEILPQLNFALERCKLFSLGSPFPTTGSVGETCQLLRSIFLFLLLSLSPSFSYHDSSNGPCIFLSSHLSALAVEARVYYEKWAEASEVHFLASSAHCWHTCACAHECREIPGRKGRRQRNRHDGRLLEYEGDLKVV